MTDRLHNTTAPQWMLARMAERTPGVLARNAGKSEILDAFQPTLLPLAQDFAQQYSAVSKLEKKVRELGDEVSGQVANLSTLGRRWLVLLSEHVPSFDASQMPQNGVVTDVVLGAREIVERVREAVESGQAEGFEAQAMIEALEQQVVRTGDAEQAWLDGMVDLQERRRVLREAAARYEDRLIAFRRVLRSELGSSHRDYQRLRTHRVQRAELDAADAELEAEAEAPVDPPSTDAEAEASDTDAA